MNSPEMRASDADRDATIDVLRNAFTEGRIDESEFDERLNHAYAAKTFGDLDALTRDLPTTDSDVAQAAFDAAALTRKRRELRGAWAAWFGVGVLVNIIWLGTWMFDGSAPYYWPLWVIGPWGAGLLIATMKSRVARSDRG